MDVFGLKHRSNYPVMLQRLTGDHPLETLKTLADIVEPVKYYTRPRTREYTQMTPLVRLVDAARPESHQGRKFANKVTRLLDDIPSAEAERKAVGEMLIQWRNNHEVLLPVLKDSPLLEEIIPLSKDVAALADAGLQAMEYLAKDQNAPLTWLDGMLAILSRPPKPEYELVIKIAPAIQELVYAANPPLITEDFEDGEAEGWEPNIPIAIHISYPEDNDKEWVSREPWRSGRRLWFLTSQFLLSMFRSRPESSICSKSCKAYSMSLIFLLPMTCPWCATFPIAWRSCI